MSVVFDFNASLNDVAPVSPILLPVGVVRKEKSELLMDVFCVFSLSSQFKLSIMSAMFDFNASLSDVAPVIPISLPVHKKNEESELLMDVFCMSFFFCLHPTGQA